MSTKLEKPIRREIDIDGELFTLDAPLTVSIVPQSLSVRIPRRQR